MVRIDFLDWTYRPRSRIVFPSCLQRSRRIVRTTFAGSARCSVSPPHLVVFQQPARCASVELARLGTRLFRRFFMRYTSGSWKKFLFLTLTGFSLLPSAAMAEDARGKFTLAREVRWGSAKLPGRLQLFRRASCGRHRGSPQSERRTKCDRAGKFVVDRRFHHGAAPRPDTTRRRMGCHLDDHRR